MVRLFLAMGCWMLAAGSACWSQRPGENLPDSLRAEILSPQDLPAGRYVAVREWEAEGPAAGHNTGRAVEDPEARQEKAWEVRPGQDRPEVPLFGPYLELPAGDYVAFFRLKLLDPDPEEVLGTLDACVNFGQDLLAWRDLGGFDLAPGRYVQVPLGFRYAEGKLECRLTWTGYTGLRIDGVSLFRLEGRDPSQNPWRAPEAQPSGQPQGLPYREEPRPFPEIFPRSAPPSPDLTVCDLTSSPPDVRLMAYTLQGLVNRTQPRLYCLANESDRFWLHNMVERGWIHPPGEAVSADQLLNLFSECVKGLVIYDPRLPATKNVATMLASVEEALVVSPRLAKGLDWPVFQDLRGRWKTSVEAYRWAFEALWPQLNHHVLACSWPEHLALRDYLVQHKVFIFWISGPLDGARPYSSPTAEVRLMEELLARMPANIPVMSYPWAGKEVGIGEGPGVSLFAEFGKYLVGSIDCSNLSVHSGIPIPELRPKPTPPPPPLQADKVYVAFILSDGDNLPVLTVHNFPALWKDPVRGHLPLGWTLSPSAPVLIPDVVDYYFRTATDQDAFLGAVSGVGYTYPDLYGKRFREPDRQRVFDGFLDQTAEYMQRSGLRELWIMGATRPEVIARFAEKIPFLQALFPDYGRRVMGYDEATYATAGNRPVFHAVTGWRMEASREERITEMVADLRRFTPASRPAFLHAFVLNWFADLPLLQEVADRLGPDYVVVRPDHLAQLAQQDLAAQQVLVRFPQTAAVLEGHPTAFTGTVRNTSPAAMELTLRVVQGLAQVQVTPSPLRLEPAQEATVRIEGVPSGERIRLELTGPFGVREHPIAVRPVPAEELVSPLPAGGVLTPVRFDEAESLAHRCGERQEDAAASDGAVWAAERNGTEPGYLVYGPYAPLAAGKYLALFRLQRTGEGSGLLALLDGCVAGGQPQTGLREVRCEELPLREFRSVPVLLDHPGGHFETRVLWTGSASLAVDSVALWKLP